MYFVIHSKEELINTLAYLFDNFILNIIEKAEKPDIDKYGEVTDEMIDNAPSKIVKMALLETKEKRDKWLNGSSWVDSSYKYHLKYYHDYNKALNGSQKDKAVFVNNYLVHGLDQMVKVIEVDNIYEI